MRETNYSIITLSYNWNNVNKKYGEAKRNLFFLARLFGGFHYRCNRFCLYIFTDNGVSSNPAANSSYRTATVRQELAFKSSAANESIYEPYVTFECIIDGNNNNYEEEYSGQYDRFYYTVNW